MDFKSLPNDVLLLILEHCLSDHLAERAVLPTVTWTSEKRKAALLLHPILRLDRSLRTTFRQHLLQAKTWVVQEADLQPYLDLCAVGGSSRFTRLRITTRIAFDASCAVPDDNALQHQWYVPASTTSDLTQDPLLRALPILECQTLRELSVACGYVCGHPLYLCGRFWQRPQGVEKLVRALKLLRTWSHPVDFRLYVLFKPCCLDKDSVSLINDNVPSPFKLETTRYAWYRELRWTGQIGVGVPQGIGEEIHCDELDGKLASIATLWE